MICHCLRSRKFILYPYREDFVPSSTELSLSDGLVDRAGHLFRLNDIMHGSKHNMFCFCHMKKLMYKCRVWCLFVCIR